MAVSKAGGDYLAPVLGPQPPPVVVMEPLAPAAWPPGIATVLGVTKKTPRGRMTGGWAIREPGVTYARGFVLKGKLGADPRRWLAVESVALRLINAEAGRAAVVVWTRPVVRLVHESEAKSWATELCRVWDICPGCGAGERHWPHPANTPAPTTPTALAKVLAGTGTWPPPRPASKAETSESED
jgi:hypothetical protein